MTRADSALSLGAIRAGSSRDIGNAIAKGALNVSNVQVGQAGELAQVIAQAKADQGNAIARSKYQTGQGWSGFWNTAGETADDAINGWLAGAG